MSYSLNLSPCSFLATIERIYGFLSLSRTSISYKFPLLIDRLVITSFRIC